MGTDKKAVIDSSTVLEIVKFNKGTKKYNPSKKEFYVDDKMSKSQLVKNIAISIQYFTGLRMNEIAKLSFSQLELLSKKKSIQVVLSKLKKRVIREISIKPTHNDGKKLYRELLRMLKSFLSLKLDFLVVSKNMNSKSSIIKKKNGKEYQTSFYPYIATFIAGVNLVLKNFVAKKESEDKTFLPSHIEKLTTHGFRNNFIVLFYRIFGNDLIRIQKLIGHSSSEMTGRYVYKYLSNKDSGNLEFPI